MLGDSMLNGIQENKLNKNADINIKISLAYHRPTKWTISNQV